MVNFISNEYLFIVFGYLFLSMLYTLFVKKIIGLDMVFLTSLYILRVFALNSKIFIPLFNIIHFFLRESLMFRRCWFLLVKLYAWAAWNSGYHLRYCLSIFFSYAGILISFPLIWRSFHSKFLGGWSLMTNHGIGKACHRSLHGSETA